MIVYIIEVETRIVELIQYHKVSQEGYHSLEQAQQFILSRSDEPEQISPMFFKSDRLMYTIRDIKIK